MKSEMVFLECAADAKMARTIVPDISLADSLPLATKISCCLQTCLGHVGQVAPTGIPTSFLGNDCRTIVARALS